MAKNAVARALEGKDVPPDFFTESFFLRMAEEMKLQKSAPVRIQYSDPRVTGLRAQVFRTGVVSYHAQFYCGDKRPFLLIGYANKEDPLYITVQDARHITRTMVALGEWGINVQDGLLPRLIRELKRDGLDWRPDGRPSKKLTK